MGFDNYKRHQGNLESKGERAIAKKIALSYIYLDRSQGQTLEQWDLTAGRLLRWNNIGAHLNTLTVLQALQSKIIIKYDEIDVDIHNMPRKSKWKYPKHLSGKDIIWCKIVLMNKVRVIGFLEENIFYIVFLDENHEFYPTEP